MVRRFLLGKTYMQEEIEEKAVRLAVTITKLFVRTIIAGVKAYLRHRQKKQLVATIRSREISTCLFLQAKSQLKAIYKDNTDTIIGNMDSQLFLGGTEPTTLKDLSQFLGKETIDMYNTGESRSNNPSYSMNYHKSGKDFMTVDDIVVMDGDKCILQLRGVRPFLSDKYDVTQHPLYKETGEYDVRNKLDIQRFLHQGIKVKSGEMFDVVKV